MLNLAAPHLSRDFYRFIKLLCEARSKDEEERLVLAEISTLKRLFLSKDVDRDQLKEYLVRAVYVEMLGFEASFAHIHAINLAQERNIVRKKAGYWACRQLLQPDSELMLLLINTIQKDLQSPHFMDIACALQCVCDLINRDMVPTILPSVIRCLDSENEHVRKHAIMAIRRFHEFDNICVENLTDIIERGICDPRPSVMGCTLSLLHDVIATKPRAYRHLVPSLVHILNQIVDRRLNRGYDYHRVPAPWIQISIISIFGRMGRGDRRVSEQIYGCLQNVLQQAESLPHQCVVIANAIIFECVKTIAAITPRDSLTTMCSIAVSRMLSSENNNLRYAGISGLGTLVGINMSYAVENQLVVVSCLEDRDETIRRRTLDLLYRMTNSKNVVTIVNCFLVQLRSKCERYWSAELVSKISLLCEKFAPSALWYFETVLELMLLAPDLLKDELLFSTVHVLRENMTDTSFRTSVMSQVSDLMKRSDNLPEMVVKMISWIYANFTTVGYIGDTDTVTDLGSVPRQDSSRQDSVPPEQDESTPRDVTGEAQEDIGSSLETNNVAIESVASDDAQCDTRAKIDLGTYIDTLLQFLQRYRQDSVTISWVLGCIRTLIIANDYNVSSSVESVLSQFECSNCTEVTQRCKEIRSLCTLRPKLRFMDASTLDISFLSDYLQQSLLNGARRYERPTESVARPTETDIANSVPELRFEPYAMQATQMAEYKETLTVDDLVNEEINCADVPRSWGPSGYVDKGSVDHDTVYPGPESTTTRDDHIPEPPAVQHELDLSILSGGARAPRVAEPQGYVWRKSDKPSPSRQHVEMARALFQGIGTSDDGS